MFDSDSEVVQAPLPFACPSCLYNGIGRCSGPVNYKTYTMLGESLVGCTDILRRQQFFDDLYSCRPPIPTRSHQERIILPAFIPGIKDGLREIPNLSPNALFAVSLEMLLGKKGTVRFDCLDTLRHRLGLPANSQVALIGTAQDWKLERFWTVSEVSDSWKRIAELGFEFATSATFSVYDQTPRADHIYNQDRNLISHDILANLGVPSIPFLFPYNADDYKDAFLWLNERPDVHKIAVLAQFCQTEKQFAQFLNNMRKIQDGLGRPIEFLVVGVAKADRIVEAMTEFVATIVTWKPFFRARSGIRIHSDLTESTDETRLTPSSELAVENINQYSLYCEELRVKYPAQVLRNRWLAGTRSLLLSS